MATVQQIFDFLRQQYLGLPRKQQDLNAALLQLKQRCQLSPRSLEGAIWRLSVRSSDLLYRLYAQELLQSGIRHTFERQLGSLNCLVQTNCPIEEAQLVVVFLHGMGASPFHFLRVANSYHDDVVGPLVATEGICPPRVTFILPFAPYQMQEKEFGALEGCVLGSYKWWDIFNKNCPKRSFTDQSPQIKRTVVLSPAPTVIMNAPPSPVLSVSHEPQCPMSPARTPEQRKGAVCCCMKNAPNTARLTSMSIDDPAGRETARLAVVSLLETLDQKFRIPLSKVVISGFSQGAMLALDVFITLPAPPAMLGIFSGAPMCADTWKHKFASMTQLQRKAFSSVPILQAHGTKDWVFPIVIGRWLNRFLRRQKLAVKFNEFEGEHEMPELILAEFNRSVLTLALANDQVSSTEELMKEYVVQDRKMTFWTRMDDLGYRIGYIFAACVLPVAKRVC